MFFFFNDTATTEIYTLSLHDALPILLGVVHQMLVHLVGHDHEVVAPGDSSYSFEHLGGKYGSCRVARAVEHDHPGRSEEHTSELQSRQYLVCRLLLEKKKIHHYSYSE